MRFTLFGIILFMSTLALAGCGEKTVPLETASVTPTSRQPTAVERQPPLTQDDWLGVQNWLYQLQRANAQRIGATAFDLAVLSISTAGSSPQAFPFPEYLDNATGIGIEDLYYGNPRDHQASPADWTAERESILRQWRDAGKLVLVVDYTAKPEQIVDAYQRSLENGFVPYVADRSLGRLRINTGFEPERTPDEYDYSIP